MSFQISIVILQSGDILELGAKRLKIALPGDPVPESKKMKTAKKDRFERFLPLLAWTLSLLCLLLVALRYYFDIGEEKISEDVLEAAISMGKRGMILIAWSVGLSFLGHELKNKANFHYHLFMVAAAIVSFDIANFINDFIAFNTGSGLHVYIEVVHTTIIFITVSAICLKAAAHIPRKMLCLTSGILVVLTATVICTDQVKDSSRYAILPKIDEVLLGPWAQMAGGKSIDHILQENEKMFLEIDK